MKIQLEQRTQVMLKLPLRDQQVYLILSCDLYQRFDGKDIAIINYLYVHFFVRQLNQWWFEYCRICIYEFIYFFYFQSDVSYQTSWLEQNDMLSV